MIFSSSFYPLFNVVVVYEVASFSKPLHLATTPFFNRYRFPGHTYSKIEFLLVKITS
jgi:hypothetical protein